MECAPNREEMFKRILDLAKLACIDLRDEIDVRESGAENMLSRLMEVDISGAGVLEDET